ncbi:MAG: hypothetical protein QXP38_05505 [Nitrososphaerota archaeon]
MLETRVDELVAPSIRMIDRNRLKENRRNYRNDAIAIASVIVLLTVVTQIPLAAPLLIPGMEMTSYFESSPVQTFSSPQLLYYYLVDHDSLLVSVELGLEHGTLAGLLSYLGIYMPATSIAGLIAQGVSDGLGAAGITDIITSALFGIMPW